MRTSLDVAYDRNWSGHMTCVGGIFQGLSDEPVNHGGMLDWKLGIAGRPGAEPADEPLRLERVGTDHLHRAMAGNEPDGRPDLRVLTAAAHGLGKPNFWAHFLHAIAYRQGMGDAIAEGGWAAAKILHLGEDIVRRYYTGWGFSGHWDGHACWHNPIAFPFWLVSALQWLTDTRDPIPSGHGYVHAVALYRDMYKPPEQQPAAVTWGSDAQYRAACLCLTPELAT